MEERKFIRLKKEEYGIKEYVKRVLGKGKISKLDIEYTPVGEKIIISTSTPGLVIGRRGEKIEELTRFLKTRFKLENPHIEIKEIENPLFDARIVADDISVSLERMGNLKFKVIAYRKLQEIMKAGALGCEIRLSGKLPSERAKSWRFSEGYLKKSGDSTKEVDRALATAITKTGMIGIKVALMKPDAKLYDRVNINNNTMKILNDIRNSKLNPENKDDEKDIKVKKPKKIKKTEEIAEKKENKKEKAEEIKISEEKVKDVEVKTENKKETKKKDGIIKKPKKAVEEIKESEIKIDAEKENGNTKE